MEKRFFICCVFFIFFIVSFSQFKHDYASDIKLNENTINLAISLNEKIILGEDIFFELKILALDQIEIFDFESARLDFELNKKPLYNDIPFTIYTHLGGNYSISKDGICFVQDKLKQNKILIKSDSVYNKHFDLRKVFPKRINAGSYQLSIRYEGQLYCKANFDVVIDYSKSIPLIIKKLDTNDFKIRYENQFQLFSIIPFNEVWYSKSIENVDTIKKNIQKIQNYWDSNKKIILLVNNYILNNNNIRMIKYEDVIHPLINKLDSKNFEDRLAARNELYNIIKKPEWIPKQDDTDDLVRSEVEKINMWWEDNKIMVNSINSMLVPELFEW